MAQVYTDARCGGRATLDRLADAGVEVKASGVYEHVTLAEPQYGEVVLGELLTQERDLFVQLYDLRLEIEGLAREYVGAAISRMGESVRNSDRNRPLAEVFQSPDQQQMAFGSEEKQEAFFRLQHMAELLHAEFYWRVSERYCVHGWRVGVRSRFRLVKIEART